VQLEKLAEELRKRGHSVVVGTGVRFREPERLDVVHIFNMQRPGETAAQVKRARAFRLAISPIYAHTGAFERNGRSPGRRFLAKLSPDTLIELGKQLRRVIAGVGELESLTPLLTNTPRRLRRWILQRCDAVIPNSRWEASCLEALVDPSERRRFVVVPNGVDTDLLNRGQSAGAFRTRYQVREDRFVLCVARFDERKNNLRLIQAAKITNIPCILIGRAAPLHRGYFEQCLREAQNSRVRIIAEHLSQEELAGAYRASWVHALPSWLETPGLSSLEAGLFGANVVAGECPAVREYLADDAGYCQPGDVRDIAAVLLRAIEADRNSRQLDSTIANAFSWSKIASLQQQVYEGLLSHHESRDQ